MKEFMLLIRNDGDVKAGMSEDAHRAFVEACEVHIGRLKEQGRLIAAQPLVREGTLVSGTPGAWTEKAFDRNAVVQVGYYHIRAEDLADAVRIAKENPEFAFSDKAIIEVRPIKTAEKATGFVYPNTSGA